MCIYCNTNKYKKIYENHHGEIPVDINGKKFHIHHVDGNHKNNNPNNLVALSEEDHYLIHLNQGDYGAASRLAKRKFVTSTERSELARLAMISRMSSPEYINPSKLEYVRKKQSESAKQRWSLDDGTYKDLIIKSMHSPDAYIKKIETRNKKAPIYHLINIISGIEVKMTRYDFIKNIFDGKLTYFNDLIPDKKTGKSRKKTVKGWKLLAILSE